jgi:hypothetical protein
VCFFKIKVLFCNRAVGMSYAIKCGLYLPV